MKLSEMESNMSSAASLFLVACYASILKMDSIRFSEMSVDSCRTTWRHMREYSTLNFYL
jgi:hypothetical protein